MRRRALNKHGTRTTQGGDTTSCAVLVSAECENSVFRTPITLARAIRTTWTGSALI